MNQQQMAIRCQLVEALGSEREQIRRREIVADFGNKDQVELAFRELAW